MAQTQDKIPAISEQVFTNVLATAYSVQQWQDRLKTKTSPLRAEQLMAAVLDTQGLVWHREVHPDTVMALIASRSQKLCGAAGSAIAVLQGEDLEYRVATGIAAGLSGHTILEDASPSFQQLRSQPIAESDTWTDKALGTRVIANSVLSMPVRSGGELVGCLQMFSRLGQFGEDAKLTCELMSAILGELIQGADSVELNPAEFKARSDSSPGGKSEVQEGATSIPVGKNPGSSAANGASLQNKRCEHADVQAVLGSPKSRGRVRRMLYPALVLLFVAIANGASRGSAWILDLATIIIVLLTLLEMSKNWSNVSHR